MAVAAIDRGLAGPHCDQLDVDDAFPRSAGVAQAAIDDNRLGNRSRQQWPASAGRVHRPATGSD